jgi:AAA domain
MLLSNLPESEPIKHWWPGRLLNFGVVLWVGKMKTCKSMVAEGDVAARLSRGWEPPPFDPHRPDAPEPDMPQYTIVIAAEDEGDILMERLIAHGGDPAYVYLLSRVEREDGSGGSTSDRFDVMTDLPVLGSVIRELAHNEYDDDGNLVRKGAGTACVILDPLMGISSSSVSYNQKVRANVIVPLQDMARQLGFMGILIGHFNRGSESVKGNPNKSLTDYIGGSQGIPAALRLTVAFVAEGQGSDAMVMTTLAANYGGVPDHKFLLEAGGPHDPNAHIRWITPPPEIDEQAQWDRLLEITEQLMITSGTPLTYAHLCAITGLTSDVVRQIIKRGKDSGRFVERRGGWTTFIPALPGATVPALASSETPDPTTPTSYRLNPDGGVLIAAER